MYTFDLVIQHTQTHTITVASIPMIPPQVAATIVTIGIPSDCSASGVVITLSVGSCVSSANNLLYSFSVIIVKASDLDLVLAVIGVQGKCPSSFNITPGESSLP